MLTLDLTQTQAPSLLPSSSPTESPTQKPTASPSIAPSNAPTQSRTICVNDYIDISNDGQDITTASNTKFFSHLMDTNRNDSDVIVHNYFNQPAPALLNCTDNDPLKGN